MTKASMPGIEIPILDVSYTNITGEQLTTLLKNYKSPVALKLSGCKNLDFEKILQNLKNLTMLTEIVSQIRANISKAVTDLVDAHGNINNLESQLKNSVSELKKELKK